MKLEEDVYKKIINTPTYKSMKIAEKLREKGERAVGDRGALGKLLKCHPLPRYQGPFTNTVEGKMYEFNSPEDDTYDFISYTVERLAGTIRARIVMLSALFIMLMFQESIIQKLIRSLFHAIVKPSSHQG